MSKRTPGPWMVATCRAGSMLAVIDQEGSIIAELVQWRTSTNPQIRQEPPANAQLMAAAPELLEACEAHMAALGSKIRDGKDRPEYAEAIYQAQKKMIAAIAKARGES